MHLEAPCVIGILGVYRCNIILYSLPIKICKRCICRNVKIYKYMLKNYMCVYFHVHFLAYIGLSYRAKAYEGIFQNFAFDIL